MCSERNETPRGESAPKRGLMPGVITHDRLPTLIESHTPFYSQYGITCDIDVPGVLHKTFFYIAYNII